MYRPTDAPRFVPAGRQSGIVLVVVLWALALMTVVVVAISAFAQRSIGISAVETDGLRSQWALRAGVEGGKALIHGASKEERLFFDGREIAFDIGGGRTVRVAIRDGAGLVDINRAGAKLLQAALSSAEIGDAGAAIVDLLANLRKRAAEAAKARQATSPPGGEASAEAALSAGLVSTSQLYGLPGVDHSSLKDLMPLVGLYSSDGKINPLAAYESVLQAIPDMKPEELDIIRAAKVAKNLKGGIASVVERHAEFLALNDAKSFVITVTATAGPGLIGDSRLQTVVIYEADRSPPRFHTIGLSW